MDSSSPFRYLGTCHIVKERWLHFDCRDFFFDRTGTTTVSGFSMCIPYTSQILIGLKTYPVSRAEKCKNQFPREYTLLFNFYNSMLRKQQVVVGTIQEKKVLLIFVVMF